MESQRQRSSKQQMHAMDDSGTQAERTHVLQSMYQEMIDEDWRGETWGGPADGA